MIARLLEDSKDDIITLDYEIPASGIQSLIKVGHQITKSSDIPINLTQ